MFHEGSLDICFLPSNVRQDQRIRRQDRELIVVFDEGVIGTLADVAIDESVEVLVRDRPIRGKRDLARLVHFVVTFLDTLQTVPVKCYFGSFDDTERNSSLVCDCEVVNQRL